jgi:hypothetical protein
MKKHCYFLLFLWIFLNKTTLKAQSLTTTVRGQITEKTTKLPIPGVHIKVQTEALVFQTVSDTFGNFKLNNVPIGRRNVHISSIGFKEQNLNNLVLTSSKDLILNIEMEESLVELQELVVKAKNDKTKPLNALAADSARQFTVEEARRYAGNFQDVARMTTNYAGVSSAADGNNDIVVRGNSPIGVLWRLEGVDIPTPSHLAFLGTEGGYSIINFNTLSNSDFITGAFPAEYGNRNAAVFDLKLRKGNPERYEFTGQLAVSGLEFGLEGPFSKTSEGQRGTFLASYRFFDLQYIQKAGINLLSNLDGIPGFQDFTFKIHQPLKNNGTLTVFGVGGLSRFKRKNTRQDQSEISNTGVTGMSYSHYYNKKWRGTLWLAISGNQTKRLYSEADNTGKFRLTQDMNMVQAQTQAKYEIVNKPDTRNVLKLGISAVQMNYDLLRKRLVNNVLQTNFDDNGNTFLYQAYAHWQHRLTEKWTFNTGIYTQYFDFNTTKSVEPRLSAQYTMHPKHRLSAAFGLHTQTQPLMYYTRQYVYKNNTQPVQTNRGLDFTRSRHIVISDDWFISEDWRLKTELYRQDLWDIPVRKGFPLYSANNAGSVESSILNIPDSLVNKGKAFNQGIELTFEKFFSKNYYLMTTLSVYESKFKNLDIDWRNSSFGHQYVWNVLGGYEWNFGKNKRNAITLDGKINFLGGKPYIPINLPASVKNGFSVADVQNAYNKRLPNFNRVDVKVAWRLNRAHTTHFIYIELNNIFNAQSYLSTFYDPVTKQEVKESYQLGFLPLGGYRVEWGKRRLGNG